MTIHMIARPVAVREDPRPDIERGLPPGSPVHHSHAERTAMNIQRAHFGHMLRAMRQMKGLGLRELARIAGISPTFLSKVETGAGPPAEDKLRGLAAALGIDGDELVTRSGRVPSDLMRIISAHPREYVELLRATDGLPVEKLHEVREFAAWAATASRERITLAANAYRRQRPARPVVPRPTKAI